MSVCLSSFLSNFSKQPKIHSKMALEMENAHTQFIQFGKWRNKGEGNNCIYSNPPPSNICLSFLLLFTTEKPKIHSKMASIMEKKTRTHNSSRKTNKNQSSIIITYLFHRCRRLLLQLQHYYFLWTRTFCSILICHNYSCGSIHNKIDIVW